MRPFTLSPLLPLLCLILAGCADDVTDAEKTTRAFTLYGYLDPKSDVQVVRVFPIQQLLDQIGPEIDAEVRYLDLETGTMHPGIDSMTAFPSGEYGHVFNGHFRARHGSTYRVEARRSDGATSVAEVTVPAEVTVEEELVFVSRSFDSPLPRPHIPLFFRGEPTWIATATAIYDIEIFELFERRQIRISYDYLPEQVEGGWRVGVDLRTDFEYIRSQLISEFGPIAENYQLIFVGLQFVVDVVNEGWYPPTGRFDADLLVEPGLMTNVENGFGFIGSGYRLPHEMHVPECLLSWAGYTFTFDPCTRADWCTYAGSRCDD